MARSKKKERLTQTTFRLSEAELRAIQEAADSWGVTPSHFSGRQVPRLHRQRLSEQADILRSVNRQSGGAAIPTAED
jgi:dissimilatory sulfite reductase (desulfoviridin) alpha/beta subunit